jgi:hypothetical protein
MRNIELDQLLGCVEPLITEKVVQFSAAKSAFGPPLHPLPPMAKGGPQRHRNELRQTTAAERGSGQIVAPSFCLTPRVAKMRQGVFCVTAALAGGPKRAAQLGRRHGSLDGVLDAGLFLPVAKMIRLDRRIATMDAPAPLPSLPQSGAHLGISVEACEHLGAESVGGSPGEKA